MEVFTVWFPPKLIFTRRFSFKQEKENGEEQQQEKKRMKVIYGGEQCLTHGARSTSSSDVEVDEE